MTILKNLFVLDTKQKKRHKIILWWELRRLLYNIFNIITLGLSIFIISEIPNEGFITVFPGPILVVGTYASIVLYFFLSNLCYTLGWIIQVMTKNFDGIQKNISHLFIVGLILSGFINFSPVILWFTNYLFGKL